jgi:hypothetical protein
MLRAENGGKLHPFDMRQHVNRALALRVHTGVVGHNSDALMLPQRIKILRFEYIDSILYRDRPLCASRNKGTRQGQNQYGCPENRHRQPSTNSIVVNRLSYTRAPMPRPST